VEEMGVHLWRRVDTGDWCPRGLSIGKESISGGVGNDHHDFFCVYIESKKKRYDDWVR